MEIVYVLVGFIIFCSILAIIGHRNTVKRHHASIISAKENAVRQKHTTKAAPRVDPAPAAPAPAAPAPEPEAAPEPATPPAPFAPPDAQQGYVLAYRYEDVPLECDAECLARARQVPPRKQLTLQFIDDERLGVYYAGEQIGEMKPGKLRDMAAEFGTEDDKDILAVSRVWTSEPLFSLYLYLSAEEVSRRWKNNPTYKEFTLVSNGGAEMQENISFTSAGERVTFEYDGDKEKYQVAAGVDIGYAPVSVSNYIDAHHDLEARILAITEKDDGKYSVRVMMIAND